MIKPVYLDLHIHTSENANSLTTNYNAAMLIEKIKERSFASDILISLTDHNTVNKRAYETLININDQKVHVILGVELHIRNYDDAPLYHAHIFFDVDDIINEIDNINTILDTLYPNKVLDDETESAPKLEKIIQKFDEYDFMILPHGGQSHRTFDHSIPENRSFDTTLERTIYYNQFDGFTARSNVGVERTNRYFKKLNINEFINLVTGSDNYNPTIYPQPKAGSDASDFITTWMLATPTFDGLRLSLSESSRLTYSNEKPEISSQFIKSCYLKNELVDIDVNFTPGLNVIIGESSSGKTLLIDSLYRKIENDFEDSNYNNFLTNAISVVNPLNFIPHYINQNYIINVINNNKIEEIKIVKALFPSSETIKLEVQSNLQKLENHILELTQTVENIEKLNDEINTIPIFTQLIIEGTLQLNPITPFKVDANDLEKIVFAKIHYDNHNENLEKLVEFSNKNAFMESIDVEVSQIKRKLKIAFDKASISNTIKGIIDSSSLDCDIELVTLNGEKSRKDIQRQSLINKTIEYVKQCRKFNKCIEKLLVFDYRIETDEKECSGHKLSIINEFKLTPEIIINAINKYIKKGAKVDTLGDLLPSNLFKTNFLVSLKVETYSQLKDKVFKEISGNNKEVYKIVTKEGKDFNTLSPGWKTAIILDLVFGSTEDVAPLLVDQPEDNLASTYMNGDLIKAIKESKKTRQIITVTHNATIPMLGDAQNVIVCRNIDGVITIRNAVLDSELNGKKIIDFVAELTDGGKSAIKKRYKKYNLKKYRSEENEVTN
ncbi:MAG: ATPase [Bacilli bacterium]